jgi:ethanolamine utilization protein EutA
MADDLVAALTQNEPEEAVLDLYLTDPIGPLENIQGILCSGGVAEYIYRREARDFGDLGRKLGLALRARIDAGTLPWPLLPDSQGIRATALGCSEFTAQLSGNTGYISDADALLPRRNLKVLRPEFNFREPFDPQALAMAIRTHLEKFELDPLDAQLVLAFHWDGIPRYRNIRAFAQGICLALGQRVARGLPCYVILDADIAMTLGGILHSEFMSACDVLVVDGLALWDFDSVDIGRVRRPSMTVPVTIKSLIFGDVAGGARRRELIHHQPRAAAGARS